MKQAIGITLLVVLGGITGVMAQDDEIGATGIVVPEYNDEGELVSQLFGDYAKIMPGGVYEFTNPKLEFYEDEQIAMRVTAPSCVYDRSTGAGKSDADVRIERENMLVTGTGFAWNKESEQFEIFDNVKVVLTDTSEMEIESTETIPGESE